MAEEDDMVNRLFDEYVEAYRAGTDDPSPFTARIEGEGRAELEALIEVFWDRQPQAEWDEERFRSSFAARMAPEVAASLSGPSGQLPVLLPRLRTDRKILVEDVEGGLAEQLGAQGDDEVEQVREYYHRLEYGTLAAGPISDRVFEALAGILQTTAEKLKAAGRALGPEPDHRGGPVYARVVGPAGQASPGAFDPGEASDMVTSPDDTAARPRTRIDDLFLGESGE